MSALDSNGNPLIKPEFIYNSGYFLLTLLTNMFASERSKGFFISSKVFREPDSIAIFKITKPASSPFSKNSSSAKLLINVPP